MWRHLLWREIPGIFVWVNSSACGLGSKQLCLFSLSLSEQFRREKRKEINDATDHRILRSGHRMREYPKNNSLRERESFYDDAQFAGWPWEWIVLSLSYFISLSLDILAGGKECKVIICPHDISALFSLSRQFRVSSSSFLNPHLKQYSRQ